MVFTRKSSIPHWATCLLVTVSCWPTASCGSPITPAFLTSSFEEYSVPNASHARPDGAWGFYQNTFVVDPFFNQIYSGSSNTRAATYAPHSGEQYVSSYAGNGGLAHPLEFAYPGTYRVSVYAASPSGSLFIQTPVVTTTQPLVSGEFEFSVSPTFSYVNATYYGGPQTTLPGAPWQRYSAEIAIDSPGTYWVGAKNSKSGVFFIYYDDFQIEPLAIIPEPTAFALFCLGSICLLRRK